MRWLTFLLVLGAATSAWAEDKLAFGPPPSWVVPVEPPSESEPSGLAVRLIDHQTRLDQDGVHQYGRQIMKYSSVAALQGAGSVAVTWQPALSSATVHEVVIRRGNLHIDVLKAAAKFSIIRREAGLEARQLNGLLTAVLEVPDLRVGDELEFSFSIDRRDPALGGKNDTEDLIGGGALIDRLHVRYSWPKTRAVSWRVGRRLPKAKREEKDGFTAVAIDAERVKPLAVIPGAPARFIDDGVIQMTDFADWREIAAVMEPLYDKAAELAPDSPVHAEIRRIAAASPDPAVRAALALQLVQSHVRYFARLDGLGGYLPVSADTVWQTRSGDCKGKTVLLLALLRGLGLKAEAAMVSTNRGDGLDKSLAMLSRFNHVVARTEVGGKVYWLDGSRLGDRTLDSIAPPSFRWALPLGREHQALEAVPPVEQRAAASEWRLDLDARAGLAAPAKAHGLGIFRGDDAIAFRSAASIVNRDLLDQSLRKIWQERHDWVTIDKVAYEDDEASGEVRISFTGSGMMDWADGSYEANKARLGESLAPERNPELANLAPVVVDARYEIVHQTILLPEGVAEATVQGEPIDEAIGGVRYTRILSLRDGRFDMTTITRSAEGEISFAEAKAADQRTDTLFNKRVFIRLPNRLAAAKPALSPDNATAIEAVLVLAEQGKAELALAELDKLKIEGSSRTRVAALRGGLLAQLKKYDEALTEFDRALALDRNDRVALAGKLWILYLRDGADDALILADRLVLVAPDEEAPYRLRGYVRRALRDTNGALADWNIAVEKQSTDVSMYVDRLNLLSTLGQREKALGEADVLAERFPASALAHAARASVLVRAGRLDEAKAATMRSLQIEPNADAYRIRLHQGFSGDDDATLREMLAAIRLDPGRPLPQRAVRRIIALPGARAQIESTYDAVRPESAEEVRDWSFARDAIAAAAGEPDKLLKRYDETVTQSPRNATALNNACWMRATYGVQLEKALADCNAAIALDPAPAFYDSRGLVWLRLKNYAEAISDYDTALAKRKDFATSLFGRGLAKARAGKKIDADVDLAEARKLDPKIDTLFADMGVQP